MRRPRPTIAVTTLAALVIVGCGSGVDTPDAAGSVAETRDGTAEGSDVGALLGILEPGVDVADEPAEPAAAAFRTGADGEGLVVGDLVRTDAAGFAEVAWLDGALARVDADTLYALVDLDTTPGEAVVVTDLDAGRIWNRLRADAAETYEVRTDVGTAAVRGTAFWVACDGACTLVDVPEGWVAEAHPDESLAAASICRYVRPDAGANEFAVIEWYAEDSDQFRAQAEQNRPFYEEWRDETAASDCSGGMREEHVEVMEPLGQGELYAYAWRVARGPLPASFDTCADGVGASFHGVVIGGQVFVARPAELPIDCPTPAAEAGQSAAEWNAHVDCLFDRFAEQQASYRELAAVLLGG